MPKLNAKKKFEQHQKLLRKSKQDPVTLYLETLAPTGRRSVRYLLEKASRLLGFSEGVTEVPWHLFEYQHVVQVRTKMVKSGYSINTINLMLAGIKGVISACFDLGLVSAEEMLRIKKLKRVKGKQSDKGRALTPSQVARLIKIMENQRGVVGVRDLAIVSVLLGTGIRRSELCSLQTDDYNARTGELIVRAGKGRKRRAVHLHLAVRKRIRAWLNLVSKDSGLLFVRVVRNVVTMDSLVGSDVYSVVRSRAESAGLGRVSPHDLRRTFVTCLLEGGVDFNIVRQLAGHENLETTARYDRRDSVRGREATRKLAVMGL